MICQNCYMQLNEGASFCGKCGNAVASIQSNKHPCTVGLAGFSSKISDPAFASYKKKSVTWAFLFAGILAVIAMVGFPIYGNLSGEIDWPGSLFYGLGIGGMFLMIALLQTMRKGFDKTWDGVVEYKDSYTLKERNRNGQTHYHKIYIIKIKKSSGRTKKQIKHVLQKRIPSQKY